ncbi:CCA tRNA nucleotidyltransferase, mitochondrial [Coemansia sp. Benny D115]|nr:CCA tRNA nucleotidyltransferase, mitochondrial [Coemansia sp. Benny D115]
MSGYDLAQHVNQYLQDTGHPVRTIAKISQNPERSKHLETATTSVLGLLVDFVNLRSEIYNSDSRIPQISYGTPSEDAFRRDITINALFYNIHTKQVEDFTARGLDDLRAGIVRTPLEPFKTFTDDPLRVLRVLRFASRFGYEIEQSTSEAIGRPEIKDDLDAKISRERVGAELEKMVEGPNPLLAIQMILQYGLYDNIFRAPGMEEKQYMVGKDAAVTEQLTRNILQLLGQTDSAALVNRIPEGFSVLSDSQARRALILSAYLYPFHGMQTPNGKRLLAQVVIRDGLKLSNQDIDAVTALHTLAPVFSQGAKDCQNDQATRTSLGLQIRQAGKRWPAAVVFAAAVEMLHQPSAQETSNVGNRYAGYADRILAENLQEAYLLKHLVDGKVAASVLGIRPGPAIKGVLEQIMEWQLGNPKGTQEQCKEYIVQVISPTLAK